MRFEVRELARSMQSQHAVLPMEDVDLRSLGRALWRAKGWIVSLALGAGVVTLIGLSAVRPLYTSESRIFIENDSSPFTRTAADLGRDQLQALDEQAVQSQVQVLTSRDLALAVAKTLDLANNPEFAKDSGASLLGRLMGRFGLGRGSDKSELEKAADPFEEHLRVYALNKSSVIAVDYVSGDPSLAAAAANGLAEAYIDWQRQAKLEQTKDATTWLSAQIEELRSKVSESEAAAEQFRSSNGLFEGSNNITLNAQQLSELNSQVILAKAQKSEAEARARLIKKMLDEKSDIDATPEVLKSELIGRLIEQRVQVQRQLAELSATLMPSHPRIMQLNSELADVRSQIRQEGEKIVRGLENEAEVANARETSLRGSLNEVKSQASGQSDAEIKLRALEREAKANRDLLESYLARYRDASSRHDMGAVPANATIVSRAHASSQPSFPKRGPFAALAAVATALLALAFVLSRELIGGAAPVEPAARAIPPRPKRREAPDPSELSPAAPGPVPLAATAEPIALAEAEDIMEPGTRDPLRALSARPKAPRDSALATPAKPEPSAGADSASAEAPATPVTSRSLFDRMRGARSAGSSDSDEPKGKPSASRPAPQEEGAPGASNDLSSYLQRRAALQSRDLARDARRKEAAPAKPHQGRVGPVLKSLEAVLNHVRARSAKGTPRIVLVAPVSADGDATDEAVRIARALLSGKQRGVLVDLTRGPAAVSGRLGLPRAPGFTDLAAGRVGFEDVVQVDDETLLQVIPAGNPTVKAEGGETGTVGRIFDALAQAYDFVVLHVDPDTARKLEPALAGRPQVVVAVLAPGESAKDEEASLAELTSFGCMVVPYEQSGGARRSGRPGLFGRAAAV
jgi:uncharacterized protein involved in exopolysaccharide biosynthesis/Mrp family chromosome partitioning ATPase